jgi:flagellar basal body-associated protein FliL
MQRATTGFNLAATGFSDGHSMIRRALIAAAVLTLTASAAHAAEPKKEGQGDVGQYVDLQPVGLPIVNRGQLVNYVFVYVRINLTSSANAARLREKEPFFRDALVRAGHRTPFTDPDNLSQVDVARLTAALSREAAAIAGPGQIRSVVVTSQAPRRRVRIPSPQAPAAPSA